MRYLICFLVACNHQSLPSEYCDPGFRNQWWLLDPDATQSLGATNDVCVLINDNQHMYISTYYDKWGPYDWTCADVDTYRIHGQGFVTTSRKADTWIVDINYHGVINKKARTYPCWFEESF